MTCDTPLGSHAMSPVTTRICNNQEDMMHTLIQAVSYLLPNGNIGVGTNNVADTLSFVYALWRFLGQYWEFASVKSFF